MYIEGVMKTDLSANTNFDGLRVAAFESRRNTELARLIEKRGGVAFVSHSMQEVVEEDNRPSIDLANHIMTGEIDALVLMTGVGVHYLMRSVERHVDMERFLNCLADMTTIARGPKAITALKEHGISVPIDVHLMIKPVDRIIPDFAKAGASYITFHPEASEHIDRTIGLIKENGCWAGLVFNPATPLHYLDHVIERLDMVLLMSVNPGFGGQSFIPSSLEKLRHVRKIIDEKNLNTRLEIDGGVKTDNIREIATAGADTFVAGSAIFNTDNYKKTIDDMRNELSLA